MPTVLRLDGRRVVIYPDDHLPVHVHVIGSDGEAVFLLHCPDGPPKLRESHGFKLHQIRRIAVALASVVAVLCTQWSVIHDHY